MLFSLDIKSIIRKGLKRHGMPQRCVSGRRLRKRKLPEATGGRALQVTYSGKPDPNHPGISLRDGWGCGQNHKIKCFYRTLFLMLDVTYLWRMKVMMIVLLCFAGYGCGSDQEKKSAPKYAYSFDHELFTAAFPLEPAVEYQTHNEIRITLVTNEITYLLHVGSIRKDAQSTLRDMTDEEALAYVADGFRNMYAEFVDHELKTGNFQGASSFELLAPEVDNPMGDYSWMKAILLQDKVIQIILSAPEKRIVDRERKVFMNQFQLK